MLEHFISIDFVLGKSWSFEKAKLNLSLHLTNKKCSKSFSKLPLYKNETKYNHVSFTYKTELL